MQSPVQPPPGAPQTWPVRRPPSGFTDGAAIELLGIAITVAGLGLGFAFILLGVVLTLVGAFVHFAVG